MPHSYGYRAHTRHTFKRPYRTNGVLPTQTYLQTFKLGDIVDIVGNGAVQAGMPHRFYHGTTGVVWNVTPRAVGVQVNKLVRHRIMEKRIHVRMEHVRHSKCRKEFLERLKKNEAIKADVKANKGEKVNLKRSPVGPRKGRFVRRPTTTYYPQKYAGIVE